jgi:hypothetical protein
MDSDSPLDAYPSHLILSRQCLQHALGVFDLLTQLVDLLEYLLAHEEPFARRPDGGRGIIYWLCACALLCPWGSLHFHA